MKYYAHSLPGRPPEEWQLLEDHLTNVAEIATVYPAAFPYDRGREVLKNIKGGDSIE